MEENKGISVMKERESLLDYKKRQSINRNKKIGLFLIVTCLISGLFIAYWTRSFNSYEELTSTPSSEGAGTQYAVYEKGYLKFSKDGISYLNQDEEIIWTEAYTMEKPTISVKGEYAVLADLEGNDVHLYDGEGKIGDYSMSYPIEKVIAAEQGVFCVILDGESSTYIRLYDKEGNLLAEIKTQLKSNGESKGYPLSVALSSDGTKLVASLYRVEGIDSKNMLAFYNFGDGGKGKDGNLVGTYEFDDMLIPKVEFMDDETVVAVGDSRTIIYQMKDKPQKYDVITFDSEIRSVFSNDKYIGYIYENAEEDVQSGKKELYQVDIYNKKGNLVRSFGKGEVHESVQFINNVIVNYSSSTCVIYRMDGTEIFRQEMGGNIEEILPTNKRREFLCVYSDRGSRVRLTNKMETSSTNYEETTEVIMEETAE